MSIVGMRPEKNSLMPKGNLANLMRQQGDLQAEPAAAFQAAREDVLRAPWHAVEDLHMHD